MCVIAYKAKDVRFPSRENMREMWDANPDGAGIMWRDEDGLVHWQKGFMSFKKLKRWVNRNRAWLDKVECALHFRITTHGGTSQGNCHPFACDATADPHELSGGADCVIMHNGILPIENIRSKDISDSAELALRLGEHEKPCEALQKINDRLTGNRIVLFAPNETRFYGDAFKRSEDKENEGILYSNLNWEWKSKCSAVGYSYSAYSGAALPNGSLSTVSGEDMVWDPVSGRYVDPDLLSDENWDAWAYEEDETRRFLCREYGFTDEQARDLIVEAESMGEDVFDYVETYYGCNDPEEREYAVA